MSLQARAALTMIFIRFEQGRGRSGVPKTWIPYLVGHPNNAQAKPELRTLVGMAIGNFRAQCADKNQGHGRDLMPGDDEDYVLHNIDGEKLETVEDIKWEQVQVGSNQETRAELVLTWKFPADLLMAENGSET
jgi:hypothetical protein